MTANGVCKPDVIYNAGYTEPQEKTVWTSVIRHENLKSRAQSNRNKHLSCLYLQIRFTLYSIMGDIMSPSALSMIMDFIIGNHNAA